MTVQAHYPLPGNRHLPGRTDRPATGPVLAAAADAPERTDPDAWTGNAAYVYGFHLLAAGYFWEAHEVWEPVWAGCAPNSRERTLVQGLIQSANAGLKLALGRRAAALKLVAHAAECFAAASGTRSGTALVMGIDPVQAARVMRAMTERLGGSTAGEDDASAIARCPELQPEYAI